MIYPWFKPQVNNKNINELFKKITKDEKLTMGSYVYSKIPNDD